MATKTLVTGCNGFVGRHLTARLLDEGAIVYGIDNHDSAWNSRISYMSVDMGDISSLRRLLDTMDAVEIYHLAAVANPRSCLAEPETAARVNIMGSAELFEFVRKNPGRRLLAVGSSEEYAEADGEEIVFSEADQLDPHNIYGATKIGAEILGRAYAEQYGLPIFFTRSFNHTGAGQSDVYVVSSFARQCAEIFDGIRPPMIEVGNIDIARDFSDVRDVISAYQAIVRGGKPGEVYNVGSGKATSLSLLLDTLIGMTERRDVRVVVRRESVRPGEKRSIRADITKINKELGWTPSRFIEETLEWIFNYWIDIIRGSQPY
jgi:GDP-4-dehydro-6-deoxy-D-mannose reductase